MNDFYTSKPQQKPDDSMPLWVLITVIVLVVALLTASFCYFVLAPEPAKESNKLLNKSSIDFADNFYGIRLDISGKDKTTIDYDLLSCALKSYDNVIISTDNILDTETLLYTFQAAHNQGLAPYFIFNIPSASVGFSHGIDLQQAGYYLREICASAELSGVFFSGWELYIPESSPLLDLNFNYTIQDLCKTTRYTDPDLFIGIMCEGEVEANAIPLAWIEKDLFDMALINCGGFMDGNENSFEANIKAWETAIGGKAETIFTLQTGKIGLPYSGWDKDDQLLLQAVALNGLGSLQFCADNFNAATTESTQINTLYDFLGTLADNNYIIKDLVFTSPSSQNSTIYSSVVVFAGASDPTYPLLMDGVEVQRDKLGHFEQIVQLSEGRNKITFTHQSRDYTFNITYVPTTLAIIYPNTTEYFDSGSTVTVSAVARKGSIVTASIDDIKITLNQESYYQESVDNFGEYYTYTGTFKLPEVYSDTNMGNIIFEGTYGHDVQTREGGIIAVYRKKQDTSTQEPAPEFNLPTEDGYIDVGTSYIAEIIAPKGETIDPDNTNDWADPTSSYLPAGTVDYCSPTTDRLFTSDGKKITYRTMRYGKKVYEYNPVTGHEIRIYQGTLPEVNNISLNYFKEETRHTTIAFNVDWRAPFEFKLGGQTYIDDNQGESIPYYSVDSVNCSYIDITFCYAADMAGDLPISGSNPIFSSAEWIKNTADWTLRLYLRNQGGFYGWNASYDEEGRLIFTFLHPAKLEWANNIYQASLKNTVILLDPGHTGTAEKGSAHNLNGFGQKYNITEAMANLTLSLEIKRQLEALGATVYLTRTHNNLVGTFYTSQRINVVNEVKPDLLISVHHSYNKYSSSDGFSSSYYTPMGWRLSQKIYDATKSTEIYANHHGNIWNTDYITRITNCPAIITENGFISNDNEYQNIITNASVTQRRAAATVKGIVDYFQSIQ